MNPRAKFVAESQQQRDRFVLRFARPRRQPRSILSRRRGLRQIRHRLLDRLRQFSMCQQRRAKLRELRQRRAQIRFRHVREFIYAAGHQKTFKTKNARFPQRLQLLGISRHHAAPESRIHPKFSRRRCHFFAKRRRRSRRRNAVQRHFDQRGHAARCRRASRGGKSFPVRAPRLIDMHVRIHHAGHHHKVARLVHRGCRQEFRS